MNTGMPRDHDIKRQFLRFIAWTVFWILASRLFYLQVMRGGYYRTLSENNYTRPVVERASRGLVVDRDGRVLCRNRVAFSIMLDLSRSGSLKDTLAFLQHLVGLDITPKQVRERQRVSAVWNKVIIKRDIPVTWVERIEAHQNECPQVEIETELKRDYPYGSYLGHALGYVGLISPSDARHMNIKNPDPLMQVGKSGVEKVANRMLMGKPGLRIAQVNSTGREIEDPSFRLPGVGVQKKPVPGKTVKLTIDMKLEELLENAFGDQTGSALFMNPKTGAILAWVSMPEYDPNMFSGSMTAAQWKKLADSPKHPLLDRPIQGAYPPGSSFKPFVALVGLQTGVITPSTTFFCPGYWVFGGRVFHCWKRGGHGTVNVYTAIQESCNVYFYHLGDLLGIQKLAEWGHHFGLGQPTGIDLPGEISGIMPSPSWKKAHHLGPWYPGDTLPVAIGQGYLTVTPMQLLSFYATIANGGTRVRPHINKERTKIDDHVDVSDSALNVVKHALWRVVNDGGT
ncbi:MAG: penicillin-binding protein 2, partial [Acidobacteriota bacterium]